MEQSNTKLTIPYDDLKKREKLFRYAFHHSIKEYISKRRLTSATNDLVSTDMTITEIAMKYQYNSPETFTRAFKKLWEITPSEFMSQWRFTSIFPKITGIENYNLSDPNYFFNLILRAKIAIPPTSTAAAPATIPINRFYLDVSYIFLYNKGRLIHFF